MALDQEITRGPRTHCIRCGTCCMKGGPTLHREDLDLFAGGAVRTSDLYTLRKGEVVRDLDEALMVLEEEMVKIKGQGETWSCVFYDQEQSACGIYGKRPLECRAMKCWDLSELKKAMATARVRRTDLLKPGDGPVKIIDAHEKRCSHGALEASIRKLQGARAEDAVQEILDLLQYDHHVRSFLAEKLGLDPEVMDFLFGRPLTKTIRMFGLQVKQEGQTFTLVPVEKHGDGGEDKGP
jgi:Fe-S-cluster containining protein